MAGEPDHDLNALCAHWSQMNAVQRKLLFWCGSWSWSATIPSGIRSTAPICRSRENFAEAAKNYLLLANVTMIYYLLAALLIIIDQITKWNIVQNFELYQEKVIVPGFFSLFYIQNEGAAWGIFQGKMVFFYLVTLIVVGYLVYMFQQEKNKTKLVGISFALILSGAIGNFIDRLLNGYVVDMFRLDFINFPIFNVADVCLTVGVVLMLIHVLFFEKEEKL